MGHLNFTELRMAMEGLNNDDCQIIDMGIVGSCDTGYTFLWYWYEGTNHQTVHSTMTHMSYPELRRSNDPMADTMRKIDFVISRKEVEGSGLDSQVIIMVTEKELAARKARERQNDLEDARFNFTENACADYVEAIWGYRLPERS